MKKTSDQLYELEQIINQLVKLRESSSGLMHILKSKEWLDGLNQNSKLIELGVRQCYEKRDLIDNVTDTESVKRMDLINLKLKQLELSVHGNNPKPIKVDNFLGMFYKGGANTVSYMNLSELMSFADTMSAQFNNEDEINSFYKEIGQKIDVDNLDKFDEKENFIQWVILPKQYVLLESILYRAGQNSEIGLLNQMLSSSHDCFLRKLVDSANTHLAELDNQDTDVTKLGIYTILNSGIMRMIPLIYYYLGGHVDESWQYEILGTLLNQQARFTDNEMIKMLENLVPYENNLSIYSHYINSYFKSVPNSRIDIIFDMLTLTEQELPIMLDIISANNGDCLKYMVLKKNIRLGFTDEINYKYDQESHRDYFSGNILIEKHSYPSLLHAYIETTIRPAPTYTLQTMIDLGANPNIQDEQGMTPIMLALVYAGQADVSGNSNMVLSDYRKNIKQLILSSADLSIRDNNGDTALSLICYCLSREDKVMSEIFKDLILSGSDINNINQNGNTPLHLLARDIRYVSLSSIDNNHILYLCALLMKLGADKTIKNTEGKRPIDLVDRSRSGLSEKQIEAIFNINSSSSIYPIAMPDFSSNCYVDEIGDSRPSTNNEHQYRNKFVEAIAAIDENMTTSQINDLFKCPIAHTYMDDPVITPDGQTYERSSIIGWLESTENDPLTRSTLQPSQLRPNNLAIKLSILHKRSDLSSDFWYAKALKDNADKYINLQLEKADNEFNNSHRLENILHLIYNDYSFVNGLEKHRFSFADRDYSNSLLSKFMQDNSVLKYCQVPLVRAILDYSYCCLSTLKVVLGSHDKNSSDNKQLEDTSKNNYGALLKVLEEHLVKYKSIDDKVMYLVAWLSKLDDQFLFKIVSGTEKSRHIELLRTFLEVDFEGKNLFDVAVAHGAKVKTHNNKNGLISMIAIGRENLYPLDYGNIIQSLVNVGVSIDETDSKGQSLLIDLCARKADYISVDWIMKFQPNVNLQDNEGMTALHYAAKAEKLPVIELLLKNGADANITNNNNQRPIDLTKDQMLPQGSQLLITGSQLLDSGETIYFGFEQLTSHNCAFWIDYYNNIKHIVDCTRNVYAFISGTEDANQITIENFKDQYSYRDTYIDGIFKKIDEIETREEKLTYANKLFNKTKASLEGAHTHLITESDSVTFRYIVYGSRKPITAASLMGHYAKNRALQKPLFSDIIISVPYATHKYSPTFSHFGLVKNPQLMIDGNEQYKNITMILKGFSSYASGQLSDVIGKKSFFTVRPIDFLLHLLAKNIGYKNIHDSGSPLKTLYGDRIINDINDGFEICDPDTKIITKYPEVPYVYSGDSQVSNDFYTIKCDRMKLFYRDSNDITNSVKMLENLSHLDSKKPLPEGYQNEIIHAYPDIVKKGDELTLDDAIDHYKNLDQGLKDDGYSHPTP